MATTKTITMTSKEIQALRQRYAHAKQRKTPAYALFQIELSDCVITAYESGKVVFQGVGTPIHAMHPQKKMTKQRKYPQCGSDEVGTGDYFGPICVCATYVRNDNVEALQKLGIQDSKTIQDRTIRILGPKLVALLPHSLLILNNTTYNKIHPTNNMVAIKSKLHNQAFVHLRDKLQGLPDVCVIDQFVQGKSYYRYLQKEEDIVFGIHFETKAENKYLSVACGAIIARYAFLNAWDTMCAHYDFHFLKGASYKVDQNIRDFVKLYGKEELQQVAKVHFANTKKAWKES